MANLKKRFFAMVFVVVVLIFVVSQILMKPDYQSVLIQTVNVKISFDQAVKKQLTVDQILNLTISAVPVEDQIVDLPLLKEEQLVERERDDLHFLEEDVNITIPKILPSGIKFRDGNILVNDTLLVRKDMIGYLNHEIWTNISGLLVDDLRLDARFPHNPSKCGKLSSIYNSYGLGIDNYGEKLFGYIIPSKTGWYRFAIASDDSSELWLSSDHQPKNMKKIACLGCINPKDIPANIPPPAPETFSRKSDFYVHSMQISNLTSLEAYRLYYIEVYHKEGGGADYVNVNWQTPGDKELHPVSREHLAMASYFGRLSKEKNDSFPPKLNGHFPSHQMQRPMKVQYIGDSIVQTTVLKEVLPSCVYQPIYAFPREVLRYTGWKELPYTANYPDDHTWQRNGRFTFEGNALIEQENVNFILNEFTKVMRIYSKEFKHFQLRFLEETPNAKQGRLKGWRYLLEGAIFWRNQSEPTNISQYIYRRQLQSLSPDYHDLCSISGFQWKRHVKVNIVVTVKNLGTWIRHLIQNMEDIYRSTKDENFTLIICDFNSTDANISEMLENSQLKPHMRRYIKLYGAFVKVKALQAGLNSISDPDEIVMTLDLHLTMPIGFIHSIRKHTIQGRMAYAPIVFRLSPGYTENDMNGVWGTLGHGLLGMFQSDWKTIGGQNVAEFGTNWGGEDWETVDRSLSAGLEVFRHRYPGLVHYYHSHNGMWKG